MIFCNDLKNPEGPTLMPDGSWLVVEMNPERGCVSRISADGRQRTPLAVTGRPNGLALDRDGTIWVAESINPASLLRMSLKGKFEVHTRGPESDPFLFPNDLVFGPDEMLYMTDSGIDYNVWRKLRNEGRHREATVDGRMWRIDPASKRVDKIDSGIPFANGIACKDGFLYASTTLTGEIYRYDLSKDRPERQVVGCVLDPDGPDVFKGCDGMAFDEHGLLYVTVIGEGVVAVADDDGKVVKRLPLEGKAPTNVAFGPKGQKRIYVTEQAQGRVEAYDVGVDGMALYA